MGSIDFGLDSLKQCSALLISPGITKNRFRPNIPGSKSYSNRVLIISSIAEGKSVIKNILKSDDSINCLNALKSLGVSINEVSNSLEIENKGFQLEESKEIYIGAAGTIARFLTPVLASIEGDNGTVIMNSDQTMAKRPMKELVRSINALGGNVKFIDPNKSFPLKIHLSGIKGGHIEIDSTQSSQFISGLLIAAPLFSSSLHISSKDNIVQKDYVLITIEVMKKFGIDVDYDDEFKNIIVHPGKYTATNYDVEIDVSSAGYFFAIAAITGSEIEVANIELNTTQPDIIFLEILKKMGCEVRENTDGLIIKGPKKLKGGFEVSMNECSDQALTLACIGPFADGPITITGVAHIRHHETDRLEALYNNFEKIGVKYEKISDGIKVFPSVPVEGIVETYDDHRVAMAFSLIGFNVPNTHIENPKCVSKTFPDYFNEIRKMGVQIEMVK